MTLRRIPMAIVTLLCAAALTACPPADDDGPPGTTDDVGGADVTPAPGSDATGATDPGTPLPCLYPAPEGSPANIAYVAQACAGSPADGSPDAPFASISSALEATGGEIALLISDGTYEGGIVVDGRAVALVGRTDDEGKPVVILEGTASAPALTLRGAAALSARDMEIRGGAGATVRVEGGEATLLRCLVRGGDAPSSGAHGVHATAGSVRISGGEVSGHSGVGVLLSDALGIILNNLVANNGGGIRIERPTESARVEDNLVQDNLGFGISMEEAIGIILNNLVSGTRPGEGIGLGDGIVLSGAGTDVSVRDNSVEGNARAGILGNGEVIGIILNNLVSGNARVGVWLEGGAGSTGELRVEANQVKDNGFVGIGLTTDAVGIILNNLVAGTLPGEPGPRGEVPMGDGIGVFAGASADVRENRSERNARCGILVDSAGAGTVIAGNTAEENTYGVVIQNVAANAEPMFSDENGAVGTDGDPDTSADGQAADATSSVPASETTGTGSSRDQPTDTLPVSAGELGGF